MLIYPKCKLRFFRSNAPCHPQLNVVVLVAGAKAPALNIKLFRANNIFKLRNKLHIGGTDFVVYSNQRHGLATFFVSTQIKTVDINLMCQQERFQFYPQPLPYPILNEYKRSRWLCLKKEIIDHGKTQFVLIKDRTAQY